VLLASCSLEDTKRSDKPLTRKEAEKELHRKLPASATNVYYLFHAGGLQDMESYLRFNVDSAEADQAIDEMIAENNLTRKRSHPYLRSSLPPPLPAKPHVDSFNRFKPIAWWQPQSIHNGYIREAQESFALHIWYDADKAIVYVYQND